MAERQNIQRRAEKKVSVMREKRDVYLLAFSSLFEDIDERKCNKSVSTSSLHLTRRGNSLKSTVPSYGPVASNRTSGVLANSGQEKHWVTA